MAHLDTETLSAYIDAELPPADMEEVGRHLASCEDCRREAQELLAVATLARELPIYIPRRRIEVEADERNRDAGPLPVILDFVKPVALAAAIILMALAGLRLVIDTDDVADDEAEIPFSDAVVPHDGTERDGETSEELMAPEAAAPELAEAPPASAEDQAAGNVLQEAAETTEGVDRLPAESAPAEPPGAGIGNGFGFVEGVVAGVVVLIAGAATWRVRSRISSRHSRV